MKEKISFAAINPVRVDPYVEPIEKELSSTRLKDNIIQWGEGNSYPNYLLSLYSDVGTLHSIIQGCIDYTLGNGVEVQDYTNSEGDSYEDVIKKLTQDWFIYGGFAIQVIKNKLNEAKELVHLPFQNVRSDKKNQVFYYSEDWTRSAGRIKYLVYPKYDKKMEGSTGVIYVKSTLGSVYPTPLYGTKTGIQACEILKEISNFHFNQIQNSFMGGYMINFNGGEPEDKIKEEIEKSIIEKFAGTGNAGRILINWNRSKDQAVTIDQLTSDDFANKYDALHKQVRSDIFTAFRANPNLFGLPTENLGFNNEEYESSFKLFNRTVIRPVQQQIVDTFSKLDISVTFKPFSLE